MNIWQKMGLFALLTGLVVGLLVAGRRGVILGALVPWCGVLVYLLYNRFFNPSSGIDTTYWPVALALGGTFAAGVGALTAMAAQYVKSRA